MRFALLASAILAEATSGCYGSPLPGQLDEVCRKMGVSQAPFFRWKKRYTGLGVRELRELRQLRDENLKLKRLVADLSLDKSILQEAVRRKA